MREETQAAEIEWTPGEERAAGRALEGLEVGDRLPDGLQYLWDGIRLNDGDEEAKT